MKQLLIEPNGWPCRLGECPPGPFVYGEILGFKSEYRTAEGHLEVFNAAGEYFCGIGLQKLEDTIVQPVTARWENE